MSPLQFSPICSRTWCLHIALWHYLSQWLHSTGRSQFTLSVTCSPYCVSILPISLKNHAYARTHVPSCRSDMTSFTELFRQTLYVLWSSNDWVTFKEPQIYYCPFILAPVVCIVSKIHPVPRITTHLPQIHFNIILPSTSRPPYRSLTLSFPL